MRIMAVAPLPNLLDRLCGDRPGRGLHRLPGQQEPCRVGRRSRALVRGRVRGLCSGSRQSVSCNPRSQCPPGGIRLLIISTSSAGVKTLCSVKTLQTSGLPGSVRFMRCGSVTICMTRWRVSSGVAASSMWLFRLLPIFSLPSMPRTLGTSVAFICGSISTFVLKR